MVSPIDIRIIGSPPTDWWNIGLTVAATIIGALIGALIAYWIARQAANENQSAANSTRRANEEAATLRAVVKFMELVNSIGGYYIGGEATISKGLDAHRQVHRNEIETWVVMLPQVGKPQEVHIEPDDLIAFTRSREFKFVTDLLNLCSAHNSMIYGVEEYGKRRDALMAKITPEIMDRYVSGAGWDDIRLKPLMPHILQVRELAEAVRAEIKKAYDEAMVLNPKFGPIVRQYFDDPKFPIPGILPQRACQATSDHVDAASATSNN